MNLDMVIRFGKYKGRTVKWVMYNDRRYFNWASENAPDMFKDYKPAAKPRSLDTQVGGIPRKLDTQNEGWEWGKRKFEEPPDLPSRYDIRSYRFWDGLPGED